MNTDIVVPIEIFYTDRGSEFKNHIIDEIISAFKIKRSLSKTGTPIDNACAESIYNIVKTEFTFNESFASIDELELKWFDYFYSSKVGLNSVKRCFNKLCILVPSNSRADDFAIV